MKRVPLTIRSPSNKEVRSVTVFLVFISAFCGTNISIETLAISPAFMENSKLPDVLCSSSTNSTCHEESEVLTDIVKSIGTLPSFVTTTLVVDKLPFSTGLSSASAKAPKTLFPSSNKSTLKSRLSKTFTVAISDFIIVESCTEVVTHVTSSETPAAGCPPATLGTLTLIGKGRN